MKAVCLIGSLLICGALAQQLTKGVSVQMAVAGNATAMPQADEPDATVVAITADGKVFLGIQATEPDALSHLPAGTVYVKADSRVPYQRLLMVLDALRGKSVVLLTASPANAAIKQGVVPPYGIRLTVLQ